MKRLWTEKVTAASLMAINRPSITGEGDDPGANVQVDLTLAEGMEPVILGPRKTRKRSIILMARIHLLYSVVERNIEKTDMLRH